jgi:hypothetical protein
LSLAVSRPTADWAKRPKAADQQLCYQGTIVTTNTPANVHEALQRQTETARQARGWSASVRHQVPRDQHYPVRSSVPKEIHGQWAANGDLLQHLPGLAKRLPSDIHAANRG